MAPRPQIKPVLPSSKVKWHGVVLQSPVFTPAKNPLCGQALQME
jgi:hypothetical protein